MQQVLVTVSIQETLLQIGGEQLLNHVSNSIEEKFNCDIYSCYRNPNYLNFALQALYGNAHKKIVLKIREKLNEFTYQEPISQFLLLIK